MFELVLMSRLSLFEEEFFGVICLVLVSFSLHLGGVKRDGQGRGDFLGGFFGCLFPGFGDKPVKNARQTRVTRGGDGEGRAAFVTSFYGGRGVPATFGSSETEISWCGMIRGNKPRSARSRADFLVEKGILAKLGAKQTGTGCWQPWG